MQVWYHANFKKQFGKLPAKVQEQFYERLKLFQTNRANPRLRVHPLKGKCLGYWSLNVNGDVRALFIDNDEEVIFALIGPHGDLYV